MYTRAVIGSVVACIFVPFFVSGPAGATGQIRTVSDSSTPVNIAVLDIETGPDAVPTRHNTLILAADELNAHGGVDGHHVDLSYYDAGLTPQQALTATTQALANHPTAIIGLDATSGVEATESLIQSSGVPALYEAQGPQVDYSLTKIPEFFRILPDTNMYAVGAVDYTESLHPKTVGAMPTEGYLGPSIAQRWEDVLTKDGVKNFINSPVAATATDVTAQVLSERNADVVMSWGLPT